ncbi:MAG TPA: putative metalloprotease CJM1_0395 family protein [Phycisphaerae bacterium]|nr:putative metalloprotease CJM1_0395 family protein [Phycisphaerae bacterium]
MTIETTLSGMIGVLVGDFSPPRVPAQVKKTPGTDRPTNSRFDIEDRVELSPAAQGTPSGAVEADPGSGVGHPNAVGGSSLTPEQKAQTEKLKRRDTEVRQHEAAHAAAAGPYARGGPHFEYQTGPDGHAYAVGGEVNIDTSPIPDDPAATVAKMETVRAAALAPADPSAQDEKVAAEATARIQQAQAEESRMRADSGAPGSSQEIPSDSPAKMERKTPAIGQLDQQRRTPVPTGGVEGPAAVARDLTHPQKMWGSGSSPITGSYAASSGRVSAVSLLDLVA